jgi:membrane associated rhomboid family serine protease
MIPIRDDQPRFSTPFVNYFLVALNVVVYLFEYSLELQSPRAYSSLFFEFGLIPHTFARELSAGHGAGPAVAIIPIFTSMFLHGSLFHLIGNMLFLWIYGDNIEDYLGHFKYLVFYLLCGAAAAITHVAVNFGSRTPTVGASGAIAGVMGAYFLLYPRARVLTWFPPIFFFYLPAWITLGYWFVMEFFAGASAPVVQAEGSALAVWAHIGGFVAGLIMIKVFPERAQRRRYGTW